MPARQTTKQAVDRIRHWRQDHHALVRRGSLTVGVDQEALDAGDYRGPTPGGAQDVSSEAAIPCLLTRRAVFPLPLRATQGRAASVCDLMGLDLDVPPSSTRSRRAAESSVDLARKSRGPLPRVRDRTGLTVSGAGEWTVRQHAYSQRRTGRKLHLASDAEAHAIPGVAVTEAKGDDAAMVGPLLEPIDREIAGAAAEGASDPRTVYRVSEPLTDPLRIPPRSHATIGRPGHTSGPPLARDEDLRALRRSGRTARERESGSPMRSLAETGVYRMKALFGAHLTSRRPECPVTEGAIRGRALNIGTHLGMAQSERVA